MTVLGDEIATLIAQEGPISVAQYMALCLGHPRYGYYVTRDPFGRAGDFTTAPEISQMFGELLGLWAAETWMAMGRPAAWQLIELGPGRGTLMADALRAMRVLPACRDGLAVHLVETSPVLVAAQRARLADAGVPVTWHASLGAVPAAPAIVIANEFLDALPIRQFVRDPDGWHERLVGLDDTGALAFGLAPETQPGMPPAGQQGDVLEVAEFAGAIGREIAARLVACRGGALLVDYGHVTSGLGDTLQALRAHRFVDPLAEPGDADLTTHVDFAAFGRAASAAGARVHGPVTQAAFLDELGIRARAEALSRRAGPEEAADIAAALARLTATDPSGMGALFKVIGLSGPDLPALPALPPA